MKRMVIMYDFDGTLIPKNMQEYTLYKALKFDSVEEFWATANAPIEENEMDNILAYMFMVQNRAKELGIALTRDWLRNHGKELEYFKGVEDYFNNINAYGLKNGVQVEHYVISSGMREMIEGSKIFKNFSLVYASFYAYDKNGEAFYPSQVVNFTNKTQFLFRLEKGATGYIDKAINDYIKPKNRLSFSNMVYVGDGLTDVPCMRIVKDKGGTSISVFDSQNNTAKQNAKNLLKDGRVNFCAQADYSTDSKLFKYLEGVVDRIAKA